MKLALIKKNSTLISGLLLGGAFLCIAYTTAHGIRFYKHSDQTMRVQRSLTAQEPNEILIKEYLVKDFNAVDQLKKHNLFTKTPPKRNPVSMVNAIAGGEALINGKWYKAGDKIQDAKILAVDQTVTIEWNGKKYVFNPGGAGTSAGSSPGGSSDRSMKVISSGPGPKGMPPGFMKHAFGNSAMPSPEELEEMRKMFKENGLGEIPEGAVFIESTLEGNTQIDVKSKSPGKRK